MKQKTSPIWNFFVEINSTRAKCKICDKVYSRKGRTTTALKSHLKSLHVEEFAEFKKLDEDAKVALEAKNQMVSLTPTVKVENQLTLHQSFHANEYSDSSYDIYQQMDRTIAEMIAIQNLPFHFVESIGFRRVMNVALPNYKLRGRDFYSSYLCDNLYNKLAKKIKDLLQEFEKISFTTDIWSDLHSGISLHSLTAHGILNDFKKMSIILKCELMEGSHSGDIISPEFETILQEWGIQRQSVHCIVRDRRPEMIKALQLSGFADVNCAIDQIQLCIRASVESQEWLVQLSAKLKTIAAHFNHSLVAQAELTKIQKDRNQSDLYIIQDCPTRKNSTFYMMESFAKLKDSLVLYLNENPILIIAPEDWNNVKKFVQIMKPFEEITQNLSSSEVSISSVIPLIQVLMTTLQQEESKPDTSEQLQPFTRKLRDELNSSTRFGELIKNDKYTIATYLDPRYKSKFFNSIVTEQIELEILNLIMIRNNDMNTLQADDCEPSSSKRIRIKIEDENQPSTSEVQSSLQTLESMLNLSDEQHETSYDIDNFRLVLQANLIEYIQEKRLPLQEDPLIWWKSNAHKYINLLPVVRQYLSAPPSSVASEQLFSEAGLIYEEHRNGLHGNKAAKLLFMKYNLPLFNFEY